MTFNKQKIAKFLGWGQLAVTYANQVLASNGGLIPTNKQGWLTLLGSLILAGGVHQASETSAGHPNGAATVQPTKPASDYANLGR